jgi:hypothetical protein
VSVPATLDLGERTRLGISGLMGTLDPKLMVDTAAEGCCAGDLAAQGDWRCVNGCIRTPRPAQETVEKVIERSV